MTTTCTIVDDILGRREGESSHNAARRLVAERDRLRRDLESAQDSLDEQHEVVVPHVAASLPEPDATNPDHLRWMAKLIRQDLDEYYKGSITPSANEPNDDWEMDYTPAELYKRADALDAARFAEREREQRIEAARTAFVIASGIATSATDGWIEAVVDALDALRGGGRGE